MRQSCLHIAKNHHATLPGQIPRENNVRLALGNRSGSLQKKSANWEAACALICRILILIAGGIIELFAGGVDKDWILSLLTKVDLRPGELKPRRFDLWRSVLDEQDGQTIGRNFVDLGHDHTKAMRIDETRIDDRERILVKSVHSNRGAAIP